MWQIDNSVTRLFFVGYIFFVGCIGTGVCQFVSGESAGGIKRERAAAKE